MVLGNIKDSAHDNPFDTTGIILYDTGYPILYASQSIRGGVAMEDGIVNEEKTTINRSTVIDGNIKAEEHLIINGTIKGNIEIKGYNLFVGPAGKLDGEVQAQNVRIRGHMKGDIKATGKVEITKEADFSGNIESKSISVEQGAYFDAFVNLGRGVSETKAPEKTSIAESTADPSPEKNT